MPTPHVHCYKPSTSWIRLLLFSELQLLQKPMTIYSVFTFMCP